MTADSTDEGRPSSLLRVWAPSPIDVDASVAALGAQSPPDADVRCILALGGALLGYGLPAHRVEESLLRLARALGRQLSVFGLPTAVMVTAYGPAGSEAHTVRAEPSTIDLSRLDALHRVVARVERGELDAPSAEQQVRDILHAPRRYPRWLDLPAVALVSFGGAYMLGGDTRDASFAALLGFCLGLLLWLATGRVALERLTPILGTVLVTFTSCTLAQLGLLAHPLVVAFAALLVLLPGLTLTLAMTELATGHLVSGAARSIGAAVVFLQLGFGVLLGSRLGGLQPASVMALPPAALGAASIGALLLALGFGVLLVTRLRDGLHTLAISALAFYVCRGAGSALGVELGVLLAATAVGVYSHAFARYRDRPSSTLTLPGVVMLVPGSLGLMAVSAAALHDSSRALDVGFSMLMVVVALSTGILISAAALPPRTPM